MIEVNNIILLIYRGERSNPFRLCKTIGDLLPIHAPTSHKQQNPFYIEAGDRIPSDFVMKTGLQYAGSVNDHLY